MVVNRGSDSREPGPEWDQGRRRVPAVWSSSGGGLAATPLAMAALGVEELSSLGAFFHCWGHGDSSGQRGHGR